MEVPNDSKPEQKLSWADQADEEDNKAGDSQDGQLADKLKSLQTDSKAADEDDPLPIKTSGGLLPNDDDAKIKIRHSENLPALYKGAKTFEELNISKELLQGVYAMGFNRPSKIQELSLPEILANPIRNMIAQAQSGTGKTASFSLGMLSRVDPEQHYPQALCVCPARELARQIFEVVTEMGKFSKIQTVLAIPESAVAKKIEGQIVIGTPGKIQDLITRKHFDPSKIKIFVLDEADHMLNAQGLETQTVRLKR